MSTYVENVVEERLRPAETVTVINPVKKFPPLLRTSSLEKIKRFPTYFCRQSSTEIYQWVSSSKTKLSQVMSDLSKQLHHILLIMSVYAAVSTIALQVAACLISLILNNAPFGLFFLVSCVGVMAFLALRAMPELQACILNRSRSRTIKPKKE